MGVNCFRPAGEECPVCHKPSFVTLKTRVEDLGRGKVKFSEKVCQECKFFRNELELLSYND
jgi:C4-type Zn-finger protein